VTDTLLELLKLTSVGVIAGVFSSALANRDHRQRKWWELRATAYQSLIEALSDLVYYYDKRYNAAIEHRDLPEDFEMKLTAYWEQSFPRVRKAADSGAFLFSDKANAALREFMQDEKTEWYIEHLDITLSKAKECLATLVECSKYDLKLKPSWLERLL
jgi:hypothetical protein